MSELYCDAEKSFLVFLRPERAMSYDIATHADVSSSQAIMDLG